MLRSAPPDQNAERKPVSDLYYAVIDTNVLVSALLSRRDIVSAPAKVIEYLFQGALTPIYNREILEEYEEVLSRNKFHFNSANVQILISQIKLIGLHEKIISSSGEIFPDLDDAVFFEAALSHKTIDENTYLVTGNMKHYPEKPFVVTPRQMVQILENRC